MSTTAPISIEQYLHSSYEPDADFVRGFVEERCVGEYIHQVTQRTLIHWFRRHDKEWQTRSLQEQRTRLDSDTVRVPDVSVWARSVRVEPVFSHPQLIVVEVLSPEDRQSRMQARIEDFRRFGVRHVCAIDPAKRVGWDCSDGNWVRSERFEVGGSPVYLDLDQLFRDLDSAEA